MCSGQTQATTALGKNKRQNISKNQKQKKKFFSVSEELILKKLKPTPIYFC